MTYQDARYWEERYSSGGKLGSPDQIDDRGRGWLCEYAGPLRETFLAITAEDRSKRILNLGCGLDRLSEDIYADGYKNLISTDVAKSAIEEMSAKTKVFMPEAEWAVDNAMEMTAVPTASVDVIVDKGTLDAILILDSPFMNAARMLKEVHRVLKPGGVYLMATHGRGDPEAWRLPLLSMPHLNMNIAKTPDLGGYYLFVCTKLGDAAPEAAAAQWEAARLWAEERDEQDRVAEFEMVEEMGQ